MENLTKNLLQVVTEAVKQYTELVAKTYNLDKEQLVTLWGSVPVKKTRKPKTEKKEPDGKTSSECQYQFQKGKSIGQYCGSRVSEDSSSGKYCKKHLKFEGESKKTLVQVPNTSVNTEPKNPTNVLTKQLVVTQNKYGNREHEETHLVFHEKSRKVYARQDGNKLVPLTDKDKESAKQYNFHVDDLLALNSEVVCKEDVKKSDAPKEETKTVEEGAASEDEAEEEVVSDVE